MTANGERDARSPTIFDDLTAVESQANNHPPKPQDRAASAAPPPSESEKGTTPGGVKRAVQELMKHGSLDAGAKPKLYATVLTHRDAVAAVLEPLDLALRVDDVRGLVFLAVDPAITASVDSDTTGVEDRADWNHPLVRRQRMTLAQSLLVALLRRRYLDIERTGDGTSTAQVFIDDLIPELQPYLGDQGSDDGERTRVRRLLEQLKEHGIVSALGENESVTIKPLICHLADPQSLEMLLAHYAAVAAEEAKT